MSVIDWYQISRKDLLCTKYKKVDIKNLIIVAAALSAAS